MISSTSPNGKVYIGMEQQDRIQRIAETVDEINEAMKGSPGNWHVLLWEMDARRELHRLLFDYQGHDNSN